MKDLQAVPKSHADYENSAPNKKALQYIRSLFYKHS